MIKPEFPLPQKERSNWKNLNGSWQFRFFGSDALAEEKAFAESRTAYDREITVPFAWGAPLSGVDIAEGGIGWYCLQTEFAYTGRLFLCFGGVDYDCDVYVNGKPCCHHQGGYTGFECEITDVWKPGLNRIEVRTEDWRRKDQTYGKQDYGAIQGIWQTVWLEARPEAYIEDVHFITSLDGNVTAELELQCKAEGSFRIEAAFDGQVFAQELWLSAKKAHASLGFCLKEVRLWSPETPELYYGSLRLTDAEGQTDEIRTYFGIREISVRKDAEKDYSRIFLNGKPIFLCGTLNQGFHPQGYFTAPDEDDFAEDAYRLKRLGLNMVRFHIKAEEPRRLYWMDRAGILVMQDIPCFWGEPTEAAKAAYELEWPQIVRRDWNHPSIFCWVMFNETWGLFTEKDGQKQYLPETQEWVRRIYREAKQLDPSRLVEDNSPCNRDHVETDLNTWHQYLHGYHRWKEFLDHVEEATYPGSSENFIGENRQNGAPMMNSECGMVWGVEGSAGDSDLGWQYHYMLNEFHLHEKEMGFIFTEFRDVVNEFNGYYRIDNSDKAWAYDELCEGMTLRDLHATLFPALDVPPCLSVQGGESVSVPVFLANHLCQKKSLRLRRRLWYDTPWGRHETEEKAISLQADGSPLQKLEEISVKLPRENTVCTLNLFLEDERGTVLSRNFTTFDVQAPLGSSIEELPLSLWQMQGELCRQAMSGQKIWAGGRAALSCEVPAEKLRLANGCELILELSSKRILEKDRAGANLPKVQDMDLFSGYTTPRGSFTNSYYMTDSTLFPSTVQVLINGEPVTTLFPENDPADVRGVLSWLAQGEGKTLDEAGSYGRLYKISIPSRLLARIWAQRKMHIELRAEGGIALYGRHCGRYALNPQLRFW